MKLVLFLAAALYAHLSQPDLQKLNSAAFQHELDAAHNVFETTAPADCETPNSYTAASCARLKEINTAARKAIELLEAEKLFRETVAVQLCGYVGGARSLRDEIRREKANPAGVVSLSRLYEIGQALQYHEGMIASLKPEYVKVRKHAFAEATEGACK